jgi:1,4-alpha-glucan branching enzyme
MALKSTTKKVKKPAAKATAAASRKPTARKKPVTKASTVTASTPAAPSRRKPVARTPVDTAQQITFTYFAPQAGSVLVAGDFTQWEGAPIRLVKESTGVWKTTVALKPGRYQYRLLVDGQWQNDPECPQLEPNAFGSANCVLSVAA